MGQVISEVPVLLQQTANLPIKLGGLWYGARYANRTNSQQGSRCRAPGAAAAEAALDILRGLLGIVCSVDLKKEGPQ